MMSDDPVVGSYYAYRLPRRYLKKFRSLQGHRKHLFRVVSVLRVDDSAITLRVCVPFFVGEPKPLDPAALRTELVYPIGRDAFRRLGADCVLAADLSESDLETLRDQDEMSGGVPSAVWMTPEDLLLVMHEQGFTVEGPGGSPT